MRKEKLVFEQANPNVSTPLSPNSASSSVIFYDRIYVKLLELCTNHFEKGAQQSVVASKDSDARRSVLRSDYLALYLEQVIFKDNE